MAATYSFGSRHAPPIVTYGVAPKRLQTAAPEPDDTGRRMATNIAGVVTPVAAITLGVMAFATTSDIPQDTAAERKENRSGYITLPPPEPIAARAAPKVETDPAPVTKPTRRDGTPLFAKVAPAPAPAPDPIRKSWQPAASDAPAPAAAVEIRGEPRDFAARLNLPAEPVAPAVTEDILPSPKLAAIAGKVPAAKELLANAPTDATEPLELGPEDEVQIVLASAPAEARKGSDKIIRRDYSRTFMTKGESRDIAIDEIGDTQPQLAITPFQPDPGTVAQIRDKIGAVKKASLPKLALGNTNGSGADALSAEKEEIFSGNVDSSDVSTDGGSVTSVSLGAVLDIVQGQLDPSDYAAFAGSSHAQGHVSAVQLEAAGIGVDYEAGSGTLTLFAVG